MTDITAPQADAPTHATDRDIADDLTRAAIAADLTRAAIAADLTRAAIAAAHPRLRDWYGPQRLHDNFAAALAEPVSWIGDEEFGTAYRDGVAIVDVADPLAWANRLLILPDGGWAVTGIRFRNRDLAKPFVEVIGSSLIAPQPAEPTDSPHDPTQHASRGSSAHDTTWPSLSETIWTAYSSFGPGKLQLFAAHPARTITAFERLGWQAEVDMYLVAGQVAELRTRPRTARFDDVTLTTISPEQASSSAENAYRDLEAAAAASTLWAAPQSLDEFTNYAADGLLFGVQVNGRLVGVVAAARRHAHGLTGFSVEEIVLDADHRGQRLAGAVLQHLVDRLPANDGDVLWGTIHPDNQASLRNALGVGREIIGANLWLTPPGWPGWS